MKFPEPEDWQTIVKGNENFPQLIDLEALVADQAKLNKTLEVISRPKADAKRSLFVANLLKETERVFANWQSQIFVGLGRPKAFRKVAKSQYAHLFKISVRALEGGFTPADHFKHWTNIARAGKANPTGVVTLPYLASEQVLSETAAKVAFYGREKLWVNQLQDSFKAKKGPPAKDPNSFANANDLDGRVRPALEGAGFDTSRFDDRGLITVQKTAKALAKGRRVRCSEEISKLANWLAENVFGGSSV